jgi:hypothetical protein
MTDIFDASLPTGFDGRNAAGADPIADRADLALRTGGRLAVPVPDLAAAMAVDPTGLEHRLRHDPRFVVLDRQRPLPGHDAWTARERELYAKALQQIDQPPLVLLRNARPAPSAGVAELLHRTVLELVDAHDAPDSPALASAAEHARAALETVTPTAGIARSTTLPPGLPPPTTSPLPRPPRPRRRPPPPGSRRGSPAPGASAPR